MSTSTKSRPATQGQNPGRKVRMLSPEALAITQGDTLTYYRLTRLAHDYGTAAYRLSRVGSALTYDLIRDENGYWSCDCPDAIFRGNPCKHGKCLEALRLAGKL